jgi:hypothetical protein
MTPLDYHKRGWRIVPIPAGQKHPAMQGWPDFTARAEDVPRLFDGKNIAVIVGAHSGDLVDVDLDASEAAWLADLYLPPTQAEFGRASKPRSHRLYIARRATFAAFSDPASGGEMLLELRADGATGGAHLTLLPPSITDGERREWRGDVIVPAPADAASLHRRAAYLAVGCLVARYVSATAAQRPGPDLPQLLWEFDHELARPAYRWLGLADPDAQRHHPRPRDQLSGRELDLAEVVHAIPNGCNWTEWNKIGMTIFASSDGSEAGFVVFDDWSAKSPKYDPHEVEERWRNYRRSPPRRLSIGSLVYRARQHGWTPRADREAGQ